MQFKKSKHKVGEERTGNTAKRGLLVNPYGPEIQTEFCCFSRGKRPEFENGGIYESPPDRYVPSPSPANKEFRGGTLKFFMLESFMFFKCAT